MGQNQSRGLLRLIPARPTAAASAPCYTLSETADVLLGRTSDCQVVLDSNVYGGVSRRHAVVRPIKDGYSPGAEPQWQICDLNSANGTFVNGQRIQGCQALVKGDRITLGQSGPQFIFEYHPPAAVDVPAVGEGVLGSPHASPQPLPTSPHSELTVSQLLPIVSTRKDLLGKGYLIPGILTVVLVVLLFVTVGRPGLFNWLIALYLGGGGFYFIFRLCGKYKPWWVFVISALFTMVILVSPLLNLFLILFRVILPGNVENAGAGFIPQLFGNFFGAGMMEELLKSLPIFGFYWLGTRLRAPNRQKIGVWEPLDGILIGAASALGFTWLETLGQYVPGIAQQVGEMYGQDAGALAGLHLLIPRILGSVAGHMAYTGIFGYFIGLSILKRSKRWQILGVGYLIASAIHAFWNASASVSGQFGVLTLMLVGILAYAFLMAAILKARQLSPTRTQNFATRVVPPG